VMGAATATAVDIDTHARQVARTNAERNGVVDRLDIVDTLHGGARFDLVCANLTIDVHEQVAADLGDRVEPGGTVVVGGILEPQADRALAAYSSLSEADRSARDGWVALELRPASGR